MAKKVIRLTESDLTKIVRRVIQEQNQLSGEEVFELQTALNDYFKMKKINMRIPVDAKWGPTTIKALQEFQKREGIDPDGIPGKDTYNALHKLGLNQDIIDKAIAWIGKLFS